MFLFLTVVQAIVAAALVALVLMQRSEGGGLGIGGGGSPGGLMSARGAADFLTRMTKYTAALFVVLSIVLAALAVNVTSGDDIDDTLDRSVAPAAQQQDPLNAADSAESDEQTAAPASDDPLADVSQ
ncbi:preprotein translocase subunit SecG [Altericroceibacterium spongiae]|uniref:Protein-export membrane protein SecG n=1 Tax=Altericroceibacterium spongiae TaxID=2320269 RepID=A0A420ESD7_9SPHN|nr:preprotein translocase subunit SecG [Altericroceibacterium spongiae]RKF23591.1 preprotein translocase subunit SecG [Altericroceibacterium spongiae]